MANAMVNAFGGGAMVPSRSKKTTGKRKVMMTVLALVVLGLPFALLTGMITLGGIGSMFAGGPGTGRDDPRAVDAATNKRARAADRSGSTPTNGDDEVGRVRDARRRNRRARNPLKPRATKAGSAVNPETVARARQELVA